MNFNKHWIIPHCITVPDRTLDKKKQQLYLAPCVDPDVENDVGDLSSQSFDVHFYVFVKDICSNLAMPEWLRRASAEDLSNCFKPQTNHYLTA